MIADLLLDWLEGTDYWVLSRRSFYEQYDFDLALKSMPKSVAWVRDPIFLKQLLLECEAMFSVPLFSGVSICAHKLIARQSIGVHNDRPSVDNGLETHRLILQLNRADTPVSGGILCLHGSSPDRPIIKELTPVHNSAVGVEFSGISYHSVSPVTSGARYSVIFTFRASAGRSKEEIMRSLDPKYTDRLFFAAEDSMRSLA